MARSRSLACVAALVLAPLPLLTPLAAQEPLTPDDWGRWERLGRGMLSPDGSWLAVSIARVNEEDELRIRPVADPDSVVVVPYGAGPEFSSDGRWLAYSIGMSDEEREKLQEENEPAWAELGLLDLRTGEVEEIEDISSYAFSADGTYLAMRRFAPDGEREETGVDLIVRDLARGTDLNFGNVAEYAWQDGDDAPARLAMLIDAQDMAGNGVQLYEAAEGRIRTLDAAAARYSELRWREDASDLALLRTVPDEAEGEEAWADTARVLLAFRDVSRPEVAPRIFDPALEARFPGGHRIVSWEGPRWSEDGELLFFGIQERQEADPCEREEEEEEEEPGAGDEEEGDPEADGEVSESDGHEGEGAEDEGDACEEEDDRPTVEIWHAADVDIVPTQKVRAERERRENHLSAWRLATNAFVQLENETVETVRVTEGADHAVGLDDTPWEADRMFGPVYRDLYLVDLETGERRKALERIRYYRGMSPRGRYLLWVEDDEYWTYDVETGEVVCITSGLETSFVDRDNDLPIEAKPPWGSAGWLEDDAAVLLYDEHDVWRVAPDGSGGERVTRGAEAGVRHRRARTDRDFDQAGIDPDEPMYFSIYHDRDEMWGYARADRLGASVERLLWDEARFSGLEVAEEADVYLFRRESFVDSPDWFVATGPRLEGARQITRTNPFQGEYAWGRAELLAFENAWGEELQGSLYYPADYEPGRQYPMIVYIYEIRSPAVRSYHVPSERRYYNFQGWVQDGYFVWQPDIVYRDRDPGVSAIASIVPSVERVIETGMVDPDGIGLIGHSWGGYQTTFAVTQTDIFSAAVAGAPLTNLFSMYLSVYWNSGGTDARIFEISQGRMAVPFWEDEEAYRRNSPVFHIEDMETPLLMAQGTEDGAVDFNQGVEFYNAARRAGKDFVFLVYNDENHGLRKEENQLDYHRRIMEWFGHYLKGEPAAEWIVEGVPYLEQPGGREGNGGG